jgi:transcriptional regulator with XRE-family HTH domain
MSYAGKNLKYLRKLRGWTQEEFANKLKIKRSLVGAYEEERAEPRIDMEEIGSIFSLLDELLLKIWVKPRVVIWAKRRAQKLAAGTYDIQFVPVKAAAGYLAGYADPEFMDELKTFTLPMLAPGNYRAFEIVGDSMLPTPSGSVIVGEKVETLEDIKTSNTYIVINRQEGIVYKRILKNTRAKNKLTLVSDNPAYQPYSVNAEDIAEVWQAQMIIARANTQQRWTNQLASLVTICRNRWGR